MSRVMRKRVGEVRSRLRDVVDGSWTLMERECGGTGTGITNGLPLCSWENEMKEYILTFP
jgi:hypothetical protein